MGWCTTSDLDRFAAAASGYLRAKAAENTLLLSAMQAARSVAAGPRAPGTGPPGPGLLFGWWEPPDGGAPRGAFVHDPAAPLLISGRAPEMAAALAATLARMGRQVYGVDAPPEAADAFAAAWSQRAGTTVRMHRTCRVYRLSGQEPGGTPAPNGTGGWPPPGSRGPAGQLRVATADDQALLADWLTASAAEATERLGSPSDVAADLISYGGAVFWEGPQKASRLREAAHYLALPPRRDPGPTAEPVALATLTRPVAGIARISLIYTLPDRRRNGYAGALTQAVSRALLTGAGPDGAGPGVLGPAAARGGVREVVLITDKNRPDHWGGRFGYQLVGERAVLRFGPPTGPLPRPQATTNPMPRLPTGPLPRLPRLRRGS
jgi:hypothetical protein